VLENKWSNYFGQFGETEEHSVNSDPNEQEKTTAVRFGEGTGNEGPASDDDEPSSSYQEEEEEQVS